ncbi:MAG: hypothetical protein C0613_09175 [Desulfobulbaceae bacterium]|nr:MAG: hypothetical protein C0613_09175 [Desulfobulbaceae bacterium]
MKKVASETEARKNEAKKHSLHGVNEHFEPNFDDASVSVVVFQRAGKVLQNQDGIGLIAALFIIVVVAMFGVLIGRYTMISSQASAEDYLWAQALYAAESVTQLRILEDDGGGNWPAGWSATPTINNITTTLVGPSPLDPAGDILKIRATATRATVSRIIEVRYSR